MGSPPPTIPLPLIPRYLHPQIEHAALVQSSNVQRPPVFSALLSRAPSMQFFLQQLVTTKAFTLSGIKRAVQVFVQATVQNAPPVGIIKPSGLRVDEMFNTQMFLSGDVPLDPSSHPLQTRALDKNHVRCCTTCSVFGTTHSSCYFFSMLRCISHGWCPPVDTSAIQPTRAYGDMSLSVSRFPLSAQREFNKMLPHGVVMPVPATTPGVVSPVGLILKNSDLAKARILTGIIIVDDASLASANELLVAEGHTPIKVRLTNDLSASGINAACYTPPFRYPSLSDGIAIVERDCYLAKGDISRYFYCFPLAVSLFYLFLVRFFDKMYQFTRCPFGLAPCPYYCSTWGAEFSKWVCQAGIPCTHMMDDWLTRGATQELALANLAGIKNILEPTGFTFDPAKDGCGQQLVFLGVLIDTVSMKMRIDAVQARVVSLLLCEALAHVRASRRCTETYIRSIAGKLGWYSEVLQSGRLHTHTWWEYYRHRSNPSQQLVEQLIADTEWWIGVTTEWGRGLEKGFEYPILSASELAADPNSLYLLQSDASGPDGYGYIHGYVWQKDPAFYSQCWSDTEYFGTSHHGELQPLVHFLVSTELRNIMLVWTTDSLSAMFSIDKGRCFEQISLVSLRIIFELCDTKGILLVALWAPRELNQLTDYLSHLSISLNRFSVQGRLSDLPIFSGDKAAPGKQGIQGQGDKAAELRAVLSGAALGAISRTVRHPGSFCLPACSAEPGIHPVAESANIRYQDGMPPATEGIPGRSGSRRYGQIAGPVSVQRSFGGASKKAPPTAAPDQDRTLAEPDQERGLVHSPPAVRWSRWLASRWRVAIRDLGVRCTLGKWEEVLGSSYRSDQNPQSRVGDPSILYGYRRHQFCLPSQRLVRPPRPRRETVSVPLPCVHAQAPVGLHQDDVCREPPSAHQEDGTANRLGHSMVLESLPQSRRGDRPFCGQSTVPHHQEDGTLEI